MNIRTKVVKLNLIELYLSLLLFVSLYYNSYRYIFQINSSGTSPTYSDTPTWLSLGKYILYVLTSIVFIILSFISKTRKIKTDDKNILHSKALIKPSKKNITTYSSINRKHSLENALFTLVYVYLFLIPCIYAYIFRNILFFEIGFFFSLPLIIHLFSRNIHLNVDLFKKFWIILIGYSLIYNFVQVVLFFLFKRLPALAYFDSISVRFGSFLDDPNGFSILLSFFIGYSIVRLKGLNKLVVIFLLFVSLIITQSVTGIISILASLLIYKTFNFIFTAKKNLKHRILKSFVIALLTCMIFGLILEFYGSQIYEILAEVSNSKLESADAHFSFADSLHDMNFYTLLGLNPLNKYYESFFITSGINFGILYLAAIFSMYFICLKHFYSLFIDSSSSDEVRAFSSGAILFMLSSFFSGFNLPTLEIFPINIFTCFLFLLSTTNAINK